MMGTLTPEQLKDRDAFHGCLIIAGAFLVLVAAVAFIIAGAVKWVMHG